MYFMEIQMFMVKKIIQTFSNFSFIYVFREFIRNTNETWVISSKKDYKITKNTIIMKRYQKCEILPKVLKKRKNVMDKFSFEF